MKFSQLVFICLTVCVFSQASAQDASIIIEGVAERDQRDMYAKMIGDINGDSFNDYAVAVPYSEAERDRRNSGQVFVFLGRDHEIPRSLNVRFIKKMGFVVNGEKIKDRIGYSVTNIGDFNNDGFNDLAIGAPFASVHGRATGQVYVIWGRDIFPHKIEVAKMKSLTGFTFTGARKGERLGAVITQQGDINKDNYADFFMGIYNPHVASGDNKKGYVFYGRDLMPNTYELGYLKPSDGYLLPK